MFSRLQVKNEGTAKQGNSEPANHYYCNMGSVDMFGFLPFGILDVVDILLVAFLLYKLYELIRGTIAIRIFFGVLSIYLMWLLVVALRMELMGQIFRQFINLGVLALIIVFQQEIRKFLIAIGNSGFFRNVGKKGGLWSWLGKENNTVELNVQALSDGVFNMAASKTGALIVIERQADVQSIVDSGKRLNAELNSLLIENIFFKNSPLHDGAMIIRGNRIVGASCMLPLSARRGLPDYYGMRHKAAIGVTEELDVVAIVVSEETGDVNIVHGGSLSRMDDRAEFRATVQELLSDQ